MKKLKIPKSYKSRLAEVGKQNGFGAWDKFGSHLVEKGLLTYDGVDASMSFADKVETIVDSMGYSSPEELIEHLLERGLSAYANEDGLDKKQLEERLRGLGYIE